MEFITVSQYAELHNLSERTVRNWCSEGKMDGAFLSGKTWIIPADTPLPRKGKRRVSPLMKRLREEKAGKVNGGIYHRTQIDLTYNSNHIEGSRLTHEQTRYIFETNTRAEERLSESFIKELHHTLKTGTSDSRKDWFNVGDYKKLPNEVGGKATCPPEQVHQRMKALLAAYNAKKEKSLEDIIDLHQRFELIHPFQDGNGRVGNGYLTDTCLTAQDNYKALLDYFKIKH